MASKKCPGCGSNVYEKSRFCPECGTPLAGDTGTVIEKKIRSRPMRDNLIILFVLVIITAGYFILKKPVKNPQQSSTVESLHPEIEGMENMLSALVNLPTDYNSLVQLGNETMDQGNYPMGAECYKRALAINDDSPDVRTDYGACLHRMGLPQRAVEEFMKVVEKYPNHIIANFNLGIVYYTEKQFDSARIYWKKYLALAPDGEAAESVRKYLNEIGG